MVSDVARKESPTGVLEDGKTVSGFTKVSVDTLNRTRGNTDPASTRMRAFGTPLTLSPIRSRSVSRIFAKIAALFNGSDIVSLMSAD
jgi:hypothetical protein